MPTERRASGVRPVDLAMSKIGRANDPALRVLTQDNGATAKLGDFLSEQQRAFLLSTEAKSVQPSEALRFSEGEAKERFAAIRWSQNGGKPTCTKCGNSDRHYPSRTRPDNLKCVECGTIFTLTNGTIFSARKMPFKTILAALSFRIWEPLSGDKLAAALGVNPRTGWDINRRFKLFQGNVRATRPVENRWPYLNGDKCEANALVLQVNKAVPRALPEQIRADVAQDLILGVLSGELSEDDLAKHVQTYIRRHFGKVEWNRFRDVSLDQPYPGTDDRSWHDVLSNEEFQERMGWGR